MLSNLATQTFKQFSQAKTTKAWSDQVSIGKMTVKNRFCLSAMTRMRADPKNGIPNATIAQYYRQRAHFGMILTEATAWSKEGEGFPGAACIFDDAQAQGWKLVAEAVKKEDSKLFIQLFHAGRTAISPALRDGLKPVAPSALAIRANHPVLSIPYETPIALTLDGIKRTKDEFEQAVIRSKKAGFDGIQIHGANGYFVDEFIRSFTNHRTDIYGGSVENRCRFVLELSEIASHHFKPYQVGVKVSPVSYYNDLIDKNPQETFSYLAKRLSQQGIGFLETVEASDFVFPGTKFTQKPKEQFPEVTKTLRRHFTGALLGNNGFNPKTGLEFIQEGACDIVSFGQLGLINPDLPARVIKGYPVRTDVDPSVFFVGGDKGYIDYPPYSAK